MLVKLKTCGVCKEKKSLEEFYDKKNKGGSLGKDHCCKKCRNIKSKDHYQRNPKKYWEKQIGRNFNITPKEYEDMFEKQNYRCAICKEYKSSKRLTVDHCHETGKVRGLLCDSCNLGIGMFGHNTAVLESAIRFLSPDFLRL